MRRFKGRSRKAPSLPLGRDGVTALEFAFIAPALFLIVLGAVGYGRALHARSALQYAVERAARCAAVNKTLCGSQEAIRSFAVSLVKGEHVTSDKFSVTTTNCGQEVSASLDLRILLPRPLPRTITVTARSCYPT